MTSSIEQPMAPPTAEDTENKDMDRAEGEHYDQSPAQVYHGAQEQARLLSDPSAGGSIGRYATKRLLAKYIPELDPENARAQTLRTKMAKRSTMLNMQLGAAASVTIINAAVTGYLLGRYRVNGHFVGTVDHGNCSDVGRTNAGLHVVLNVVSSLFLASGNYCMQLLAAPTRDDVDGAASQGQSLEIGVPSLTNLRYIKASRVLTWLALGCVSVLLHLFWNSALFTSQPIVAVPRAVVTSDFQTAPDDWAAMDPIKDRGWWKWAYWQRTPAGDEAADHNRSSIYDLQAAAPRMRRLEPRACIDAFVDTLAASSGVVVVAGNMTSEHNGGSSLIEGWVSAWEVWSNSAGWICRAYQDSDPYKWRYCSAEWAREFPDPWVLIVNNGWNTTATVAVDHCLVGEEGNNDERCGLHYSASILALVCICTVLNTLLVWKVRQGHRQDLKRDQKEQGTRSLVTIGDAIQSFLEFPRNAGASGREQGIDNGAAPSKRPALVEIRKKPWIVARRVSWLRAVSKRAWLVSLFLFSLGLAVPIWAVASSLAHMRKVGVDISAQAIWDHGLKPHPSAVTSDLGPFSRRYVGTSRGFLANVLIANSPQILMSFLYLFYNNLLTRQLVADEWLRFLGPNGKKPLRVSTPVGMQRSSYALTLPLAYSGPLLGLSATLHWLISQSIFLVQTSVFEPGTASRRLEALDGSARGYSHLGALLALVLAFLLVVAIVVNAAVRTYKNVPLDFQRAGHDSSIIEVLCRRPAEDEDAHLFPISMGMVKDEQSMRAGAEGRMVFSTDVELNQNIEQGKEYLVPELMAREKVSYRKKLAAFCRAAAKKAAGMRNAVWFFDRRRAKRNEAYHLVDRG